MENQGLELLSLILQCLLHATPVHVSGYPACWRVTGLDPGNVQSLRKQLQIDVLGISLNCGTIVRKQMID